MARFGHSMKLSLRLARIVGVLVFALGAWTGGKARAVGGELSFQDAGGGGFRFDTGEVRGWLHTSGKSLGLQQVVHRRTGIRLDDSQGLLSHYRVFTRGKRYGAGAWDWPSKAERTADGAVKVSWPAAAGRPFEISAMYRWVDPWTVEMVTAVRALEELPAFETFVASYFSGAFTNAGLGTVPGPGVGNEASAWLEAGREQGEWQVFPRDEKALEVVRDGRWRLEPNPVEWVARRAFGSRAMATRRDPVSGLEAVFTADPEGCFAILMPHQTEGHRSLYFSLFGADVPRGGQRESRIRLRFGR